MLCVWYTLKFSITIVSINYLTNRIIELLITSIFMLSNVIRCILDSTIKVDMYRGKILTCTIFHHHKCANFLFNPLFLRSIYVCWRFTMDLCVKIYNWLASKPLTCITYFVDWAKLLMWCHHHQHGTTLLGIFLFKASH